MNFFQFHTELPMTVVWANDEVCHRVAQLVFDEVLEVLRVSGLYRYDQLSVLASDEQIMVQYSDDRFGFEVNLQNESLKISRRGSSMDRFHRWYVEVAPHFGGLVEKVCDIDGHTLLNSEVLEELVPRCPGEAGSLASTETETKSIARLDATFQKWQQRNGRTWIEIYSVEAPSNRDWSSIWTTFSMVGRSFEGPSGGVRTEFEAAAFISDYVTPYIEFLRDRGLQGFLSGLTAGRTFSTTAGSLP